jgi:hypothetical protein
MLTEMAMIRILMAQSTCEEEGIGATTKRRIRASTIAWMKFENGPPVRIAPSPGVG